ncbi:MAG: alcohol dehydrogenase [Desulfurococcales archaeon ex4484_58]|nr:MAG: alcohol dehydrogenase [Desulfurococcales archaeon ex4484_58]
MRNFMVYSGGVKLFFGTHIVDKVSKYLDRYSKLLIVTGRSSARISGALNDIVRVLEENGVEYSVWDKAFPNPTDKLLYDLVEYYRCVLFEGFIGIGGGSVLDLVKAARVLVVGGGKIDEYIKGTRKPPEKQPFMLAVNLTHGTGSEIDRFSVITLEETGEKVGFTTGYPTVSIDDPRYTVSLPIDQTIYTSLDAFAHAVESATSKYSSPYTELLARESISYIVEYLPKTINDQRNVEYRYWLLYASMIAGISIDHGYTHIPHILEHILTGYNSKLSHGAGLAILYKELIGLIYKAYPEIMAKLLKPIDQTLKPISGDYVKAVKAYNSFIEKLGFDETLSDYGFTSSELNRLIDRYGDQLINEINRLSGITLSIEEIKEILNKLL